MLSQLVTRALSHLSGRPVDSTRIKGSFRYAYASDDGRFVAILGNDQTTYIVDLSDGRYFADNDGAPRGFSGHVLQMEDDAVQRHPWPAYSAEQFDLDMDADEIEWKRCPLDRGRFH